MQEMGARIVTIGFKRAGGDMCLVKYMAHIRQQLPVSLFRKLLKELHIKPEALPGAKGVCQKAQVIAFVRNLWPRPAFTASTQARVAADLMQAKKGPEFFQSDEMLSFISELDPETRQVLEQYTEKSLVLQQAVHQ